MVILKTLILSQIIAISVSKFSNPCGQLYLTQSPYENKNLQLNWHFNCEKPPDRILLTFQDILRSADYKILYEIKPGAVYRGHHDTPISFKNVQLPGNWTETNNNPDLNAQCFDYYIASVRNNQVVYSQCLSIQPTWMSNFGNLRIGNLMIPGTHNSGAWRGGPSFIQSYVLNQDRNFWQQLVYGIRYFDIRVGRYGNPPNGFFINHSFIKCTELLPELLSAANFLRKSPKEVIILNFYRFPRPRDFTRAYHLEILNLIRKAFGDLIYPFYRMNHRQGPKLNEFWLSKQRVIVSYRNDEILREMPWLWPSVQRHWGNKQKVQSLETYIKNVTSTPTSGNPMNVLMAELTPNYLYIFKHGTRNLKDLSLLINRELSDWLNDNNRSNNLNIIATDFFTGNDIVNVAIETNFKKLNYF